MKKEFSNKWIASSQTRKQRKYRMNAPLHIKYKFMASNLSKELRKKMRKRNIEARKGDTVKVMRGRFAGKTGKITNVDLKKTRVIIEGMQNKKKDGTKVNAYFHPSKIQITELGEGRGIEKKTETKVKDISLSRSSQRQTKGNIKVVDYKQEKAEEGKNAPDKK